MNTAHWTVSMGFHSADLYAADINSTYFAHGPLLMDRWPEDPANVRWYVPGMWRLVLCNRSAALAFFGPNEPARMPEAWAVMDDFGNLVRIQ